jgi:trans-aconitate methyltransferase
MKTLLELYNENRATGRYFDTNKELPRHHYLSRCYDTFFAKYQNRSINVLEIGVASGGSLILWKDYFPNAQIFGVDVGNDDRFNNCLNNVKDIPNITVRKSDAYTQELVDQLPNLDIIIDDGPHTLDSHYKLFDLYMPKLNPGGMLIIEDIEMIEWTNLYISKLNEKYINQMYYSIVDTARPLEYNSLAFIATKL